MAIPSFQPPGGWGSARPRAVPGRTEERAFRDQVELWRYSQLRKAGVPADDAIELARRGDVDIHEAVAMIERGCPVEVAVGILR